MRLQASKPDLARPPGRNFEVPAAAGGTFNGPPPLVGKHPIEEDFVMTKLRTSLAALALGAVTAGPAFAQNLTEEAQREGVAQSPGQQQQQAATPGAADNDSRHARLAEMIAAPDGVGGPVLAMSRLMDRDGLQIGATSFQAAPTGTLVRVAFTGAPPGPHALHVHETGTCQGDFKSAGGHFNPTNASHGYWHEGGPHVGDLPTVFIPQNGETTVSMFNEHLRVDDSLLDDDGAALVLHAKADDYRSQPAGDAGDRIACGEIKRLPPQSAATGEAQAPKDMPAEVGGGAGKQD